ncbi:Pyruvate kinase [Methylophaga frappieri]|uniref:Pyruvate kinase n=1 Tax=Methylophaga frappieri (strain ATCC BAA-2434 / DSM 25690 / JAM7) TaxID=754477 RepID=I1YK47_METFJ|nr:pyruvate kinase [Methylophaga frappieri]AFJ03290.1 Pyruvate kinase [Methylophaga frappieri]
MTVRRRTKIVATIGPASADEANLQALIRAGVDVFRLNFSHGEAKDHLTVAERIRQCAAVQGRQVGILVDLQGPKIRISRFRHGGVTLVEGASFTLDTNLAKDAGDQLQVGVDYQPLANDVGIGDTLLLDDGRIVLEVQHVVGSQVQCVVATGGRLTDNKGINRLGGGLSADALTEKDRIDIKTAATMQADYLAISFPRSAKDMDTARHLLQQAGGQASLIAKIERAEVLDKIDDILAASEGIMVARGDLGVEIGDAALPPIQKQLITTARQRNRVVITATQMMESMIHNPIPTRAEVFDVANAVLDGTDAVMLSGETAVGQFPVKVIEAVNRICLQTEQQRQIRRSRHRIDTRFTRLDEAIAMSAMYLANHLDVKAIAALTESGSTPLWMSRISSGMPIFALTPQLSSARRMTLFRGVYPLVFALDKTDHAAINRQMVAELQRHNVVTDGDVVILTKGDPEQPSTTNTLKLVIVGELIDA